MYPPDHTVSEVSKLPTKMLPLKAEQQLEEAVVNPEEMYKVNFQQGS